MNVRRRALRQQFRRMVLESLEQRRVLDNTYHALASGPLLQNWSNKELITAHNDWSMVPSIIGYRGDGLVSSPGVSAQNVTRFAEGAPLVNVTANQPNPNSIPGGVAEFDIPDPTVAIGGAANRAPFLLIHLDTRNVSAVRIQMNLRDITSNANNAAQQIAIQQRIGETDFDVVAYYPDVTIASATMVTPVDVMLPESALNQAQVQLRILTTDATGTPDEWVGIDDIVITGTLANAAPVVTLPGAALAYVENDPPQPIQPLATVADADSSNFDGGTLTATLSIGATADDRLSVLHEGTGAGEIGVSGSTITFGGATIGTMSGGTGATPLSIALSGSAATPAAVEALSRRISYANVSESPATAPRTLSVTISDGDGATSSAATATINVSATNDVPVLALNTAAANYNAGDPPHIIAAAANITDLDATLFAASTLTVSIASAQPGDALAINSEGNGSGQILLSGSDILFEGLTVGIVSSNSPLVATFNSSATLAAVRAVLRSVTYQNTLTAPVAGMRNLAFQFAEGDGATSLEAAAQINVIAAVPNLTVGDASISEGESGTKLLSFSVSLSSAPAADVVVSFTTEDGTATVADADYAAVTSSRTFTPSGALTQTIGVVIQGDTRFESTENFILKILSAPGATIVRGQATGEIVNDDAAPKLSIAAPSPAPESTSVRQFVVSLSNASAFPVTVDYATADGSATLADADYVLATGTLTFNPGQLSQPIDVAVSSDTKFELDEQFGVTLSAPAGGTIDIGLASATIQNDDARPTVAINAVALAEGDAGLAAMVFEVALSNPSYEVVTVDYATANGTATLADNDFQAATGILTFAANTTVLQQTLAVPVVGDHRIETDETFQVHATLTGALNAEADATGTILNDDAAAPVILDANSPGGNGTNNSQADAFRFVRRGDFLDAFINGNLSQPYFLANITEIRVNGSADNDTLTVDYNGGYWQVPGGIHFDAASAVDDADALQVTGDPGFSFVSETYAAGQWRFDPGSANGPVTIVVLSGLEVAETDVRSERFDVVLGAADDSAAITNGGLLNAAAALLVAGNDLAATRFTHKTLLRVSANSGADAITLNANANATDLVGIELFGHAAADLAGLPNEDNAIDTLTVAASPAGVTTKLFGQGGSDEFLLGNAQQTLDQLLGPVEIHGGGGDDHATLADQHTALLDPVVVVTSTSIQGLAPALVTYEGIESLVINSADQLVTNIDVINTAAGTSTVLDLTHDNSLAVVTVGNSSVNFGNGQGSLANILGALHLLAAQATTLQIDATAATAALNVALNATAGITSLTGAAPATISSANPASLALRLGAAGDSVDLLATTALATTIDTGSGEDVVTIHGDRLSGNNTLHGGGGNDAFLLAIDSELGAESASTLTGLTITGDANSLPERDRVTIEDASSLARSIVVQYEATGVSIASGYAVPIALLTIETLFYDGDHALAGKADAIQLVGSASDDDFTIAQPSPSQAIVFAGGNALAGLPGVSGGSTSPDVRFHGIHPTLQLSGGGGGPQGNRLIYRGLSEAALVDPSTSVILIPAAAAGAASDQLLVDDTRVFDSVRQVGVLLDANTFTQTIATRPALHVLGGDESIPDAAGATDTFQAANSNRFAIRIEGGSTLGDRVSLTTSGDLTLFEDAAIIGARSSNAAYPVLLETMDGLQLQAATGVVHVLGDHGSGTAQADVFDMTLSATPLAAQLTINGSPAISLSNVSAMDIAGALLADALTIRGTSTDETIAIASQGANVTISGWSISLKLLNASSAAGDVLTIDAGAGNDALDASLLSVGLVSLTLAGGDGDDLLTGSLADDILDGGAGYDAILVQGTASADTIDAEQTVAAALRVNVNGVQSIDGLAGGTIEELRIIAGAGADAIRVQTADGLSSHGTALIVHVIGGTHLASGDTLTIVDHGSDDLTIHRPTGIPGSGAITIGPGNSQPFEYIFEEMENLLLVDEDGAALNSVSGGSRLVVYPPEASDLNNDRLTATALGFNSLVSARIEAGDSDYYRVDATATGTLEFRVRFEQIASITNSTRPGLPGDGDLSLEVFDSAGARIVPAAPFGTNDSDDHERIRIPAVAGQTYYLRVFGTSASASNGYTLLALNEAVSAPHDFTLVSSLPDLTNDSTPRIRFRFDDSTLRSDTLPLFDETILIPFQGSALAAGFRIAVFDGDTRLGYAVGTATPGEYEFETPTISLGVHFLSARVEIIDPSLNVASGPSSGSLRFVVDASAPAVPTLSLRPENDTGVAGIAETFTDRITSILLPGFIGTAEPQASVRLFFDSNANTTLDAADVQIADATSSATGQWQASSLQALPAGLVRVFAIVTDLAGNTGPAAALEFFIDTQAPAVTSVFITGAASYNLAAPQGVTPLVSSLSIRVHDLGARASGFLYQALIESKATNTSSYVLRGDFSGPVTIQAVQVEPLTVTAGQPAEADVILHFTSPLPDDRFTLDFANALFDAAGNASGAYSTRFTIDSRAEVGTWATGSAWVDTNGNGEWDPRTPTDFTNRDIAYAIGNATDAVFAGNFGMLATSGADGFEKLAVYGPDSNGNYRFLVDVDNDGAPDNDPGEFPTVAGVTVLNITGQPIAGRFDNNDTNGDEVGVFTGTGWYFDTNHNYVIDDGDLTLTSALRGRALVGDFDGDGFDDLATWQNDRFAFDLTQGTRGGWDGTIDWEVGFGFDIAGQKPVASDMDGDGIDDVGLWVPELAGPQPETDWYFIVSGGRPIVRASLVADDPGHRVVTHPDDDAPIFFFQPQPFHHDLHLNHGDAQAMPLVGNFDPPATLTPGVAMGKYSNGLDVDGDGRVTPVDAVLVINSLNAEGIRTLTSKSLSVNGPFLDVSGDRAVTPLDALLVINHLNSVSSGEGEAPQESQRADSDDLPPHSVFPWLLGINTESDDSSSQSDSEDDAFEDLLALLARDVP